MKHGVVSFLAFSILQALSCDLMAQEPTKENAGPKVLLAVSSADSQFGVQGTFIGSCEIQGDSLKVNLENGELFINEKTPYQGERFISWVAVGLVEKTPENSWKFFKKVTFVKPNSTLQPGEKLSLESAVVSLPIEDEMDLSNYWIAFEIGLRDPDSDPNLPRGGTCYAHSQKTIFKHFGNPDVQ